MKHSLSKVHLILLMRKSRKHRILSLARIFILLTVCTNTDFFLKFPATTSLLLVPYIIIQILK